MTIIRMMFSLVFLLVFSATAFSAEQKQGFMSIQEFTDNWELVNLDEMIEDPDMMRLGMEENAVIVLVAEISPEGRLVNIEVESETPDKGNAEIVARFAAKGVYKPRREEKKTGWVRLEYRLGLGGFTGTGGS